MIPCTGINIAFKEETLHYPPVIGATMNVSMIKIYISSTCSIASLLKAIKFDEIRIFPHHILLVKHLASDYRTHGLSNMQTNLIDLCMNTDRALEESEIKGYDYIFNFNK